MEVSLAELESIAGTLESLIAPGIGSSTTWVRYEAEVRSAHANALVKLRNNSEGRCCYACV